MKLIAKRILLVVVLFCSFSSINAQIGLSIGRTMPRGNFGKVFKPATMLEVNYQFTEAGEKLRAILSLGFMKLNTTRDTFETWSYVGGSVQTVSPRYEIYKNYYSIPIAFKNEYIFLNSDLSPMVGLDCYVFFNSFEYISTNSYVDDSNVYLGYFARIGANYIASDYIDIDLGFGRTATYENGDGTFKFWKTYLGVNYQF